MTPPVVLTVAATDSGGAAGIAADLATFGALRVHGSCAVTTVTAQDTTGVQAVHRVPLQILEQQLDAVLNDLPVSAAKTGLLGSVEAVRLVANRLRHLPLVVDPVIRATTGARFADEAVITAYREHLLPVATVVTPNLDEARALAEKPIGSPTQVAALLAALGPAVVVTGGSPGSGLCTDHLAVRGEVVAVTHAAVATHNDHGTGCTFSAAVAALLARPDPSSPVTGSPASPSKPTPERLRDVVRRAGLFTTDQLRISSTWQLGRGRGSIAHLVPTPGGEA